ncbi:hypothetical protein ACOMHN_030239 [Nucella lapillus]
MHWKGPFDITEKALALLGGVGAQYHYYEGKCPPENYAVAAFRNLTDVREPLPIPLIDRVLKDVQYATPGIQEKLEEVDLAQKIFLPLNNSLSFKLFAPFLDRCCGGDNRDCRQDDLILQFIKFEGGPCWVVWPEAYYVYKRCTCCTCLLHEDCPVVGRCVESNYHTVEIIAYCGHIMYSDRFQKIALRIPTVCRCQASCPTPLDFILPAGVPTEHKRKLINGAAVRHMG